MRLDRFITLNVARPFRDAMASLSSAPRLGEVLPILMYHSVSCRDESHVGDYYKLCTSPERFRLQMETLREHGFFGTDLESGLRHLSESAREPGAPVSDPARFRNRNCPQDTGSTPPQGPNTRPGLKPTSALNPQPSTLNSQPSAPSPLPVVLTFDDGLRDFYTEALPVLAEFGFTATMFLPTAFIGDTPRSFAPRGSYSSTLNHRRSTESECLTWSEVRECQKFGIRFGAHTVSHAKLYELPWPDIEIELRDGRTDIEDRLGRPVTSFAYPYAFPQADRKFCARLRETLVTSGYESCVTTIAGRVVKGDDPFALRRLPVNGADDAELLAAKVTGCYDWMAPAQSAVKRVKGIINGRSRKD